MRGGKDVHQLEVLVYHAYFKVKSVFGAFDRDFLPVYEDLSFVGKVNARKHIHESGLAAAVFSEDGQDLPFANIQVDLVVRYHRAKRLGDVFHFNSIYVFQNFSPSF